MRCACVDIGTNTTRLLVAERSGDGLREVVSVRRFARLKPAPDGGIPTEAIARIADLSFPNSDPVSGAGGPLVTLWKVA